LPSKPDQAKFSCLGARTDFVCCKSR
jgi:hypothetical protein